MKPQALQPLEGTQVTEGTVNTDAGRSSSPTSKHRGTEGTVSADLNAVNLSGKPPVVLSEPVINRPTFITHDNWFQLNGRNKKPGLYWHGLGKGDNPEPVDTWVCSPIHTLAITANENSSAFGLLLRFINPYGQWIELAVPMYLLKGSGEELRGELLDMGVRIDSGANRLLNSYFMSSYPKRRIIAAPRTGWHETPSGLAFVMPHRVLGSDEVWFQPEQPALNNFTTSGSLDGWREQIATPCRKNLILLLSVSASFSGPLLKVAKHQEVGGAGIHLIGDSSLGKTTSLQAAASVWGASTFVRTWRATANGLEATAASLNDTFMPLDEIGESDSRDIGAIIYALSNGMGKQRARRTGGARETARWRVTVLSTGERSLDAHMGEAGGRAKAGQQARLLDVPATTRKYGAFDNLHGESDGRAFADAIKRATDSHYGHAGPAFVEALLNDQQDLPALYAAACSLPDFRANNGVEARAASTFALIGMAGELATEYGITGWPEGEAMQAAIDAYKEWRSFRGEGPTETRQILEGVRNFILLHGDSRFSNIKDSSHANQTTIRERAGYWRDSEQGRVYLFNSPALREATSGFEMGRILDALEYAGWLVDRDADKRSKKVKVAGSAVNLYVIRPKEGATP